jgi:hypothetical protein
MLMMVTILAATVTTDGTYDQQGQNLSVDGVPSPSLTGVVDQTNPLLPAIHIYIGRIISENHELGLVVAADQAAL